MISVKTASTSSNLATRSVVKMSDVAILKTASGLYRPRAALDSSLGFRALFGVAIWWRRGARRRLPWMKRSAERNLSLLCRNAGVDADRKGFARHNRHIKQSEDRLDSRREIGVAAYRDLSATGRTRCFHLQSGCVQHCGGRNGFVGGNNCRDSVDRCRVPFLAHRLNRCLYLLAVGQSNCHDVSFDKSIWIKLNFGELDAGAREKSRVDRRITDIFCCLCNSVEGWK